MGAERHVNYTAEEKRAVAALRRLAKRWPPSLRLVLVQSTGELFVANAADCLASDDLALVPKEAVAVPRFKVDSFA